MLKRLPLVLAILTVVIVCSYFITGKVIQKRYYETIASINTQPTLKVNLVNYERGFFHSNAELTVELGADNLADAQIIQLKQVITHGPIIAAQTQNGPRPKVLAVQISTSLNDPWDKKLQEYTGNPAPLSIITLVNFSNVATTWMRLTSINQSTPTDFHVEWAPINGLIEHDLNFAYYHGFITLPKLVVNNIDWKFDLKNLTINLDANKKEAVYSSSNTLTTENLTYAKNGKELIKLDDISAKLAFFTKDNNLAFDLEATVVDSQIVDQHFKNDNIRVQADNINRATLAHMPRVTAMSAKATVDLLQELTVASTNVTFEVPKHFTEALLAYLSFEVYRTSYMGRFDHRPAHAVLEDISGTINKLVQGAVKQELFLDKGTHYALNFKTPVKTEQPQG